MELNKELEKLKSFMGGNMDETFKKQANYIRENFTSESDRKIINQFIKSELSIISYKVEGLINIAEIHLQLLDIKEIVSLSYISKNYFKKTRSWLHHKINGNIKNGKPCAFTKEELTILNFALQDISKKIGAIAIKP